MKIKHLFFDLDGTLINSGDGIMDCFKYTFEKFNFDYSGLNLKKYIGPPLETTFNKLTGGDEKLIQEMIITFKTRYLEIGTLEKDNLYDGIVEMIKDLYELGFDINLATSKPEIYAVKILDNVGLSKYFNNICGASIDGFIKEKEQVLEKAINLTNPDKNQSVMIGDRKYDLNASEKLGLNGIGVLYGFGEVEELESCKYVYLAKTPLDLYNYIIENKGDF